MAIEIRRLERGDAVEEFDCGDDPLNTYLKRYAWKNQERNLLGVTHVSVEQLQPRVVIGYYTLATSSVLRDSFPPELVKRLPYRNLPVALLARLAVDRQFQGGGLGKLLVGHALKIVTTLSKLVGCRCLVIDAYPSAVSWYTKFGFLAINGPSTGGTQLMFIDLRTVEDAIEQARRQER